MTSFAEILAGARRPETTVALCLRGDLVGPYRDLERRLGTASRTPPSLGERSEASGIAEQMRELETQMRAAEQVFTLRAFTAKAWSDFYANRPERGKDESEDAHRDRYFVWVCDLVSRSAVDPEMTPEQVGQLCDALSGGQWDELTDAAWRLNSAGMMVPFSFAASALIPSEEPS